MNRRDFMLTASAAGFVASCSAYGNDDVTRPKRQPLWDLGQRTVSADVVVYGATPGGVTAAIAAARAGASVVIVGGWRDIHLGGMMSGGLGFTDMSDADAYGGLSGATLRALGSIDASAHANNPFAFDPKLATAYFEQERIGAGVPFLRSKGVIDVQKRGRHIHALQTADGIVARGRSFIDASYEGDLMARAGISYHVGRASPIMSGGKPHRRTIR